MRQRATGLAMFGVLLGSYVINAMDRQVFPLVASDVRRAFGLGIAETGLMATILMLGMALAGMPTAWLLGRLSRKRVLLLGIAIFSAGTALSGTAGSFGTMLAWRALTGIGEAMQLTVIIAVAANYFAGNRATAIGSVNVAFGLGNVLGPLAGGMLLAAYGSWRTPLFVFGAIGIPAMLAVAVLVRSRLTEAMAPPAAIGAASGAASLWNRNTIVLTLLSAICGLLIYGYLGLYPTYLREQLHYAPAAAGAVMGVYGMGVMAAIAGGWLGDRLQPRTVLVPAFVLTALLGAALFHGPADQATQAAISFGWGLVLSGVVFPNLSACHVKAVQGALSARATGLFVTSIYGAGAIAGLMLGSLVSGFGWTVAADLQFVALSLVAAGLAATLKPIS